MVVQLSKPNYDADEEDNDESIKKCFFKFQRETNFIYLVRRYLFEHGTRVYSFFLLRKYFWGNKMEKF